MPKGKVRIGIAGLGRLGKRHAANLASLPNVRLAAACSLVDEELEWARSELALEALYTSYEEMVASGQIDAAFIVSSSAVHAKQSILALEKGLHVFCEKPIGVNVEECRAVERAVESRPGLVYLPGFVRRFDPSFAYAKRLVDEGAIGTPFLVRSQTVDLDEYAAFQVKFVPTSGGIFLDMNIHDIDLARWFLGDEVESVHAMGGSFVHPEFEAVHDADNTVALARFRTGKMAVLSVSRTAFHGHDTHTEVTGSKGTLKIGITPAKNRVELFDAAGARVECVKDFYERFAEGFMAEAREFVDCVLCGRKPIVTARDGTAATEVGFALAESFRLQSIVRV